MTSAVATNNTKKAERHHESALIAAAHILVCLTQEGKSIKEVAKDFDNNLELVTVWIDYMTAINWIYNNKNDGKWIATDNGKKWVEKILQYKTDD